jgi:hypothetical protein
VPDVKAVNNELICTDAGKGLEADVHGEATISRDVLSHSSVMV